MPNFRYRTNIQQYKDRFWKQVDILDGFATDEDCWLWTGKLHGGWYGQLHVLGKTETTSRLAWLLYKGEIPAGMEVCHTCDTPSCVNPSHLFLATSAKNTKDSVAKGRHTSAKLHSYAVSRIKGMKLAGMTQENIAVLNSVCQGTVSMILSGKRRRNG